MRTLAAVIAATLSACAMGAPNDLEIGTTAIPEARIVRSLADWNAHGLQDGTCRERAASVRMLLTSQDEVFDRCQSRAMACTVGDLIIVDEQWVALRERIVEHELRHWMGACAYRFDDAAHEVAPFWYGGVAVADF